MKIITNPHFLIKVFVCLFLIGGVNIFVKAQSNPSFLEFNVKQGTSYTFQIASTTIPDFQLVSTYSNWGNVRRNEDVNGDNIYEIDYTAPVDFQGTVEFLFSYTGRNAFPYYTYTKQVRIMAHVVPSLISTEVDIVLSDGDAELIIFPLDNDQSSEGQLKISKVAYCSNGSATIVNEKSLKFIPGPEFDGKAYLKYIAEDQMGTNAEGNIYIISTDEHFESEEISMIVSSEYGAYIFLPKEDLNLIAQTGNKGEVVSISSLAYFYMPISGRLGNDQLIFQDLEGNTYKVFITVIDHAPDLDAVQDDEFYTAVDQEIVFNVAENDLIDASEISYYSPELEKIGDGIFKYTPPTGFVGFKKFVYKVNTGSNILTGNITVKVDNYFPQEIKYNFKTPKNKDLVIEYDIPLEGYYFSSVANPKFGTLEFFSDGENVDTECGLLGNIVKVVYTPRKNFIGYDEFSIQYCTAVGNCEIIKSKISVYEDQNAECPCLNGCIYPGDANKDGIVNLADVLAMGYYLGHSGPKRKIVSNLWQGYKGEDWPESQTNGVNLKYVDADGDGYITNEDTSAISLNFGKYSGYIPNSVQIQQKSPIKLVPQSSNYIPGEPFLIDVHLGDDRNPALDIHGVSFSINLDPALFDIENTVFLVDKTSWLAEGFGTITMSKNGESGKIEVVISRTSGLPKSGKGKVGTFSTIGVDEIEGFENEELDRDRPLEIDIDIDDVSAIDSKGKWFTLPTESIHLTIPKELPSVKTLIKPAKDEEIIYPNPANLMINISAAKDQLIKEINMYDILGRKVYHITDINNQWYSLPVHDLQEGVYILEIAYPDDVKSHKVRITR